MQIPLLDACVDPQLLGADIQWRPKQLDVLRLFGDDNLRLVVVAAGRQGGKSSMAVATAIWSSTCRDDLSALLPRGRTRYALIAAPSESQSRELIRVAAGMVDASPVLRSLATVHADEIRFRLPSGAQTAIRALPANPRSIRGMSADTCIGDEASHFNREDQLNNDQAMIEALEGSMNSFSAHGKEKLLLLSSPRGQQGRFYELFCQARDGLLDGAAAVHAPAWELNPALDTDEWRESKRQLLGEDGFLSEHGAEFVAGGGQWMDLRGVELADEPWPPEAGYNWIAGLDPAFHNDRFGCVCVGISRADRGVLLVGSVEAIDPGGRLLSFARRRAREDRTLARVHEVIEPYGAGLRIVTDQHQQDAVRSWFGQYGYAVTVVNLTLPVQTAVFTSTRTRILDGSLRLWSHPGLIEDLKRIRVRQGMEGVVLPRYGGGHIDAGSALALATWAHRFVSDRPPMEPRSGSFDITRDTPIARQIDGRSSGRTGDVDGARHLPDVHEPADFYGPSRGGGWMNEQF